MNHEISIMIYECTSCIIDNNKKSHNSLVDN
jgi:hypothetical protein